MESSLIMQRRITDLFGDLVKTDDNADQCSIRHEWDAAFEDKKNCKKLAQAASLSSLADHGEYQKVSFLGDQETIFAARAETSKEGPRRPKQRACAAEVVGKSEDVRDYTSTMNDGVVAYVDSSMKQDNSCDALESKDVAFAYQLDRLLADKYVPLAFAYQLDELLVDKGAALAYQPDGLLADKDVALAYQPDGLLADKDAELAFAYQPDGLLAGKDVALALAYQPDGLIADEGVALAYQPEGLQADKSAALTYKRDEVADGRKSEDQDKDDEIQDADGKDAGGDDADGTRTAGGYVEGTLNHDEITK